MLKTTATYSTNVSLLSIMSLSSATDRYRPGNPLPQYKTTALMNDKSYAIVYRILLFLSVQYVLPMVALIALNARVVWCLRSPGITQRHADAVTPVYTRRFLKDVSMTTTATSSRSPWRRSFVVAPTPPPPSTRTAITRAVVVIVLLCTVCHAVAVTSQVLWSVQAAFVQAAGVDRVRRVFGNVANLALTVNSAVNFLIYCALSRNFRRAVLDNGCLTAIVCCRRERCFRGCCRVSGDGRHEGDRNAGRAGNHGCKTRSQWVGGYSVSFIAVRTKGIESSAVARTQFA